MKRIFVLLILIFSIVVLVSCNAESKEKNYNIVYNLNGGILPSDAIKTFKVGNDVILPLPNKENHIFKGWYDEENKLVTDLNGVKEDVILNAKWEEFIIGIEYSIEYVLNGGFFKNEYNSTYKSGVEYILPIPTKAAHKFVSWYEYDSNEPIEKITSTMQGNIKVYAHFEKATIVRNINYHLDGGVLPNNTSNNYTEGVAQNLPTPTKEGYYFRGWYTTNTFENIVTSIGIGTNGDKDLYAKWVEKKFENANFGILGDSISSFYDSKSSINSLFTKPGQYYFPKYNINSVKQTWWYKTIEKLGANLFVSNSYSGGTVHQNGISSGNNQERIDMFNYNAQIPDVIIVYLGINDTGGDFSKEFFKNQYQEMIDKIQLTFPEVQIFVCTLPYTPRTELNPSRLRYNEAINEIASTKNIPLIDFASAWTELNYSNYLSDALHPNIQGMDKLSEIAVKKIKEFYGIA